MLKEVKKRAGLYGIAAIIIAIILGSLFYNLGYIPQLQTPKTTVFKTFSSSAELQSFLTKNSNTTTPFLFLAPADMNMGPVQAMVQSYNPTYATPKGLSQETQYSTTNIQVAGVDEADIVKTDGTYLYVTSGTNVFILKAYLAENATILSQIPFNNTNLVGIFVNQESNRLAVLGCKYIFPDYYYGNYYGSFILDIRTFLNVYDISNKSEPMLLSNFTMTGSYFSSRMIGDYVYFVVSQPAYVVYDTVILPKAYPNGKRIEINASDILYSDASANYFMYTTVIALNIQNTNEEPNYKTLLLGSTSCMYASLGNIYITFPESISTTAIYRIKIENSTITPEAKGTVSGRELNQFSMDEYGNYFRIATTARRANGTTQNNLHILNMNLSIIGSLTDFAPPNEILTSARFIGNRCYLSTSVMRQDPFFVVDIENATEPKVLGYLAIPGFTSYLHPYDENHIIGIGRDINFSVKISIFDVSNVSNPIEIDMYSVVGFWTDTMVLTDHKAFLFGKSINLLAIPVSIQTYWDYEYRQWQGLYVFNITLNSGLILRGNVTHQGTSTYYWDTTYCIKRALYIENVLYTLSDKKLKLNSLEDLTEIKEISFP